MKRLFAAKGRPLLAMTQPRPPRWTAGRTDRADVDEDIRADTEGRSACLDPAAQGAAGCAPEATPAAKHAVATAPAGGRCQPSRSCEEAAAKGRPQARGAGGRAAPPAAGAPSPVLLAVQQPEAALRLVLPLDGQLASLQHRHIRRLVEQRAAGGGGEIHPPRVGRALHAAAHVHRVPDQSVFPAPRRPAGARTAASRSSGSKTEGRWAHACARCRPACR